MSGIVKSPSDSSGVRLVSRTPMEEGVGVFQKTGEETSRFFLSLFGRRSIRVGRVFSFIREQWSVFVLFLSLSFT